MRWLGSGRLDTRRRGPGAWLLIPALAGCGGPGPGAPVPVEGAPPELVSLAGTWDGRYWNDRGQGKGHGTIRFQLAAGADTARGRVEMTFAPELRLYREGGDELSRSPCTSMDIAIVRVELGTIRGTLAPYWHPRCDCRVLTVFEGALREDRIEGTFVTRREGGGAVLSTGRWRVEREGS